MLSLRIDSSVRPYSCPCTAGEIRRRYSHPWTRGSAGRFAHV